MKRDHRVQPTKDFDAGLFLILFFAILFIVPLLFGTPPPTP